MPTKWLRFGAPRRPLSQPQPRREKTMEIHTHSGVFTIRDANVARLSETEYLVDAANFTVLHSLGATEYYRHGWNSWTPTRWWCLDREPWRIWDNPSRTLTAEDAATDCETQHHSSMVTVLNGGNGESLLVGALDASSPLLTITESEITASSESDTACWFITVGTESEVFSRYATALRERHIPADRPLRALATIGPIWSSWYSWFEEITEDIIRREIHSARDLGYGAVQIDDGWERRVGDWRANQKFPCGITGLSEEIHAAGLKTGLWVAPFIALPGTPVVEQYPELFLHDASGNLAVTGYNWGQDYFALDLSAPRAHEWLAETMSQIASWGIDLFKLDFIYAAAVKAERVQDMPREEAYRRGLETIHKVVGDDVYLLGSGAVVNASLGVLDGIRVGPDTAPYWDNLERHRDPSGPGVVNALRNSLSRTWLKPLLDCDPDVAFFRTRGSLLSPEINALTVDASLVCGYAQSSCPAEWLSESEREEVREWTRAVRDRPEIRQVGRYRYVIAGREVDFDPYLNPKGRVSDRLLVK